MYICIAKNKMTFVSYSNQFNKFILLALAYL